MKDKNSNLRKVKDRSLNMAVFVSAGFVMLLLLSLVGFVMYKGLGNVTVKFLITKPSLINDTVGILPNILNTVYVVVITLMVVLPIGIGAAIYLNEYAKNKKAVRIVETAAETLSGIPSIIYGLVGMLVFVRFLNLGTSILAGSLTMAIVSLPTVMRTTQESLKTVPKSYREGALALGCGKWYMIRTVVLPSATNGIVTGGILSVGRIVGESAALLFTAGMANEIMSPIEAVTGGNAGSTMSVALYTYAKERGEIETAYAIAAILLVMTFCINFAAKTAAKHLKRKGCK